MTTYISVNRQVIQRNAKTGSDDPPLTYRTGKSGGARHARELEIDGPSRIIYSNVDPILSNGARLVIATEAKVKVIR